MKAEFAVVDAASALATAVPIEKARSGEELVDAEARPETTPLLSEDDGGDAERDGKDTGGEEPSDKEILGL